MEELNSYHLGFYIKIKNIKLKYYWSLKIIISSREQKFILSINSCRYLRNYLSIHRYTISRWPHIPRTYLYETDVLRLKVKRFW